MNDDTNSPRLPNKSSEYNYKSNYMYKFNAAKSRLSGGITMLKTHINDNFRLGISTKNENTDLNNVLMALSQLITSITRLYESNQKEHMTQEQLLEFLENALHNSASNIVRRIHPKPDFGEDNLHWKYPYNTKTELPPAKYKQYDLDLMEDLANLLIKLIADIRKK